MRLGLYPNLYFFVRHYLIERLLKNREIKFTKDGSVKPIEERLLVYLDILKSEKALSVADIQEALKANCDYKQCGISKEEIARLIPSEASIMREISNINKIFKSHGVNQLIDLHKHRYKISASIRLDSQNLHALNHKPKKKKILIVDDDTFKIRELYKVITNTLSDPQAKSFEIDYVVTVEAAKEKLAEHAVDILILDMQLPMFIDSTPQNNAGTLLLEEIIQNEKISYPPFVIGISKIPDCITIFNTGNECIHKSILYDENDEWKNSLKQYITQCVRILYSAS